MTSIEPLPGGFSAVYPVLRRLEDTGRVRRGYFVAGLGAAQFAQPGAVDLLRAERDAKDDAAGGHAGGHRSGEPVRGDGAVARLAGSGSAARGARRPGRSVVLVDGHCAAWIARGSARC